MADLSITVGEVQHGTDDGTVFESLTAGAAITQGQPCYLDESDGMKAKPADADASAATALVRGLAVGAAEDEQKIVLQRNKNITLGASASIVQGKPYYLSITSGGISDTPPASASDNLVYLGTGNSANGIRLDIDNTGISST